MSSFVIEIAINVNRGVEINIIIPAPRFKIANVPELVGEANSIKSSLIIRSTFFLIKFLYFFLY